MGRADAIDAYAEGLRTRLRLRSAEHARRATELRERAHKAAVRLVTDFGATRVWLFGSLAWGAAHPGSDVDLFVEGLPALAWSDATRVAEDIVAAPVDLVRAEEAAGGLAERVHREGILLHERR